MFESILSKYDPRDLRSHGVLKFFVDGLQEEEMINFVNEIFTKGSWVLPTEIIKYSESSKFKDITEKKFNKIFSNWISERIIYSSKISKKTKNPRVTIDLTSDFREILISLKNLNFSSDQMLVLKRFIEKSHPAYLSNFFKNSLSIVVEEYSEAEIEAFFLYFSSNFSSNFSLNYRHFIYIFLLQLSQSHKIYDLSDNFLQELKNLSSKMTYLDYNNNYTILISILLCELICDKKLDLSEARYTSLINQTLNNLDKSSSHRLDFFRFLKKFNYNFCNYDFNSDIIHFLDIHSTNISILKSCSENYKTEILHHYLKSGNDYFETLLFFSEQLNENDSESFFLNFFKLVNTLRQSFYPLLWYDEFLNFKPISGRVHERGSKGFIVKIDEDFFKERASISLGYSDFDQKFISHYGFGFLVGSSFTAYKSKALHDYFESDMLKELSIVDELNIFYILKLNYSDVYKGKSIQLVPENKSISTLISKFGLKGLFSIVEIFLIEKAYQYLNIESPFLLKTNPFKILNTPEIIFSYKVNFSEETFWRILNEIRPDLYESIYVAHKRLEESFGKAILAFENNQIIEGVIRSRTNGGMIVDIFGIEAFLPGSQIDVKPVTDYDSYIGKKMNFQIQSINNTLKNIVISHKSLIANELEVKKNILIEGLRKGMIMEGVVKNITTYGVFVDLGGFDGLIHITDLSWSRISNPNEIFKLDQSINVMVLDFDDAKTRIQLGRKQLSPDPWEILPKNFKIGLNVKGKVTSITDYGSFLEFTEGIEGLLHNSELSWSNINQSAYDYLNIGDEIEVRILTLDKEEKRMSVGLRQLKDDPWENIEEKYPIGSIHTLEIIEVTNFGVFMELTDGIIGMVHITDLSWTEKFRHPSECIEGRLKMNVAILDYDIRNRKLALGHKQTKINPWLPKQSQFEIGTTHCGYIKEIFDKGATVKFSDDIIVFIPNRHLTKINNEKFILNESCNFKIIENNKSAKKLVGSHKLTYLTKQKVNSKIKNSSKKLKIKNQITETSKIKPGDVLRGRVIEIADYGAYLKFDNGFKSLVKVSELTNQSNLKYAQDLVKIGDYLNVVIISVDNYSGEILSSLNRTK